MQPRAVIELRAAMALACAAVMATVALVTAHHSFSAEFDASQPVRLEGALSRVEWTNPHVWLYVAVADPARHVVTWAIEATTPSALARRGLRLESLPPGLKVIVPLLPATAVVVSIENVPALTTMFPSLINPATTEI